MSVGWNFERRRDTCARFAIGVFLLAEGKAERDTSLEKVRSRMRLSPEEALFAARRLDEEKLLVFDAGGAVRSNTRGMEHAVALMDAVRSKAQRFHETMRMLRAGGTPVDVLAAVLRADGEALACGAPDDDADGTYRLALVDDSVVVERRRADGAFEPAPNDG
jgi:hypothetical protein